MAGIHVENVKEAFAPVLSRHFVAHTTLCNNVSALMMAFDPRTGSLDDLMENLRALIRAELNAALGSSLRLSPPDAPSRYLYPDDIDYLADEAMWLWLTSSSSHLVDLDSLRSHAMRSASFSAIKMMFIRYGSELTPEEKALWGRILREDQPEWRYRDWLKD